MWSKSYTKSIPKETQIHQFFSVRSTKGVEVTIKTPVKTNEGKDSYDEQLRKELEMYSTNTNTPQSSKKLKGSDEEAVLVEKRPEILILKKDNRRISKFLLNKTPSGEGKRSRFFPVKREGSPVLASVENQETPTGELGESKPDDCDMEEMAVSDCKSGIEKFKFSQPSSRLFDGHAEPMDIVDAENFEPREEETQVPVATPKPEVPNCNIKIDFTVKFIFLGNCGSMSKNWTFAF